LLLVGTAIMIIDHTFNCLREIKFGLAQGLRTSDFSAGLLNDMICQFNRLLNRRIERLRVLFSHNPGLLAQWGQSLAIRDPDSRAAALPRRLPPAPLLPQSRYRKSQLSRGPGADAAPVEHLVHDPEQIPLDHEAVQVPDALLRANLVQIQVLFDWGVQFVMHDKYGSVQDLLPNTR
jgi:hypothetical protein